MMRGYYKREEETNNAIRDGWLWTGDLASMDEDGFITIRSRSKDLIKYKGHSVYPAEVEELLHYHEAIEECGVIGILDDKGDENIKAFIELKEEYKDKISEQDIIEWAKKNMGFDKYPRFVEFVDEVPKTMVGKVSHLELRQMEDEKKK
jgi:long-chain acyl-CoA synthetase